MIKAYTYIYSSGSVQAQKLLFGFSDVGDLTPLLSGYFDTRTGAKRESSSYLAIASAIQQQAEHILFISDIKEELDAAKQAGGHAYGMACKRRYRLPYHSTPAGENI